MSFSETAYNLSPVFLQNVFVSLYGVKLFNERYRGGYKQYLRELLTTQWMKKNEITEHQNKQFLRLIDRLFDNIPFYQEFFKENGISRKDFKSIEDLKKLPILDKETVRTNKLALLANNISPRNAVSLNTSGTTGKTLQVFVDIEARRKEYAFITRSQKWAGLENGRHNITFGGRTIIPISQKNKIFWRYNAIMDNYLFSSYHLSEENLPYYVNKIKEIRPAFIDSYPSSVYCLAKYMVDNSVSDIHPRAILTTAETLLDYQRDMIENVFGCKVFDQYGCTEQAMFVSQCEKGQYHIHPEYGICEIVDDDYNEVKPGEMGQLICTGFLNKIMPLPRYAIGDTVGKGDQSCECGRYFPTITKIHGRKDDIIITPDGRRVGRLDPIFKGLTSVKMAQIIQKKINEVEILLIPGIAYTEQDGSVLKGELQKRVGSKMEINISLVKNIPRTKSGKFRSVISQISSKQ